MKTKGVEDLFQELDDVLKKMEDPDSTLEQAFQYYETGMKLVRACNDKIDKVEKKILILQGKGGDEDEHSQSGESESDS